MDDIQSWLMVHSTTMLILGGAGTGVGFIAWLAGRIYIGPSRNRLTANCGGVIVGRDNHGLINTGKIGVRGQSATADALTTLASWSTILGLPIAAASLVIAIVPLFLLP